MHFVIILLSIFSALFCNPSSSPDEIALLNPEPSAIVGGYIHVITGDFVYRRDDLTVEGPIPLTLERFFTSKEKTNRHEKWELQRSLIAHKIDKGFYIPEESGIVIPYHREKDGTYVPNASFFKEGSTFSSTHNPKLNRARVEEDVLIVERSDGTRRAFWKYFEGKSRAGKKSDWHLVSEKLKSGYVKRYSWDISMGFLNLSARAELREIRLTPANRSTPLSSITFTHKGSSIKAKGSNRKRLEYELKRDSDGEMGYLQHINSSDHPRQTLRWKGKQLVKYIFPDKRKIHLSYRDKKIVKLELPENMTYEFEYYDDWTNVTHPDRSNTTYYHSNHRLDKIVHYGYGFTPLKTTIFEWTEEGKLSKKALLDANEEPVYTIEYDYDGDLNLISKRTTGAICSQTPTTLTTNYQYDSLHRLTQKTTCQNRSITYKYLENTYLPTEIIERNSAVTTRHTIYTYDKYHLLIKEEERITQSSKEIERRRLEFLKNPGKAASISYYIRDNLIAKENFTYDKYGNVETLEHYGADQNLAYTTKTIYNKQGQVTKQTDRRGYTTRYKYNANREPIKEKRANGLTLLYTYDQLGRLHTETASTKEENQTTTYKYHKHHHPSWIIDPEGDRIHNQYDPFGNLTATTLPDRGTTTYTYNPLNHITSKTDPRGYTTHISPNLLGDPLNIHHPDGTSESYTYTPFGKPKTHIDAEKQNPLQLRSLR